MPRMALPAQPRLVLRDLLPGITTTSNLFEFPRETARSGAPDYQYPEATDKVQGDFTYSLVQNPIATIAFWIAASRQLIDDSVALTGYVNGRLLYLLQAKIEYELLFGDGSSGHILGLATQATAATGATTNLIDGTAAAIEQLAGGGWIADFICCAPTDACGKIPSRRAQGSLDRR
jgi:HK97 family phage major capsid protein